MLRHTLQFTAITLVLLSTTAYAQTDVPATEKAATSTSQANSDAVAEKPAATSPARIVAAKPAAENGASKADVSANNTAEPKHTGKEAKPPQNSKAGHQAKSAPDAGEESGADESTPDARTEAAGDSSTDKANNTKKGDANPAPTRTSSDKGATSNGSDEAKQQAAPAQPANTPAASSSGADSTEKKVSTEALEPKKMVWPFGGMRGTVDKQAAQRGFQIYAQVCSVCHSMNLVSYRDLGRLGFSAAEIKAIAAQKQVPDQNDNGETIQRAGKPFDHFAPPYPNEKASRAANNGAYPPDLSLIIKAREEGPDYVYSILTGFGNPPPSEPMVANKYYNPYFQGHWISMPPPLREGAVTYQDGTTASVDQMASDVVSFLQWAAEPEMEARHEMGLKVLGFLIVMAGFFYAAKKRVWRNLKH